MQKIKKGFFMPSAALVLGNKQIKYFSEIDSAPDIGDVAYGEIQIIGQHKGLENKFGRIHSMHRGSKAVFIFGNRYAPDMFEGEVPKEPTETADLLSASGVIGQIKSKHSLMIDPTKIKLLGYIRDAEGTKLNTKNFPLIRPTETIKKFPRSKLILVCGTSMNSGKSVAAAACIWTLNILGYKVRASKITGTASLKEILLMNDAGAHPVGDFTYFGFPSTYLAGEEELLDIFNKIDLKYANNPENFWVVEFADGINQRETMFLLNHPMVKSRIHKLIFCAHDAFGAIGGLMMLREKLGLMPDAISGICSNSPLHIREIRSFTDIPIFNSVNVDPDFLGKILLKRKPRAKKLVAN